MRKLSREEMHHVTGGITPPLTNNVGAVMSKVNALSTAVGKSIKLNFKFNF